MAIRHGPQRAGSPTAVGTDEQVALLIHSLKQQTVPDRMQGQESCLAFGTPPASIIGCCASPFGCARLGLHGRIRRWVESSNLLPIGRFRASSQPWSSEVTKQSPHGNRPGLRTKCSPFPSADRGPCPQSLRTFDIAAMTCVRAPPDVR